MLENIGRYKIQGELGKGAMAIVYQAFDPGICRTLAVKVLRDDRCENDEYRDRFIREAKAAGQLVHSNIVTVYDVGEVDGNPYIAMEELKGDNLEQIINFGQKLSLNQILDIGIQLADALDYAHAKGVVHRDIKPSNIILEKNGQAKITDFGIAHIDDADKAEETQIGTVLGTPHYMSPEQANGQRLDGRSDLYSVGVILYQLLTGEKLFNASSLGALMAKILQEEPKSVREFDEQIPPDLAQVVSKLLKKQPEKRYQAGRQLVMALTRIKENLNEQLERGEGKRLVPIYLKWSLMMAAVLTVTLLIGLSVVYDRQHRAMAGLLNDYGVSLGSVLAIQSAEPMLFEEWAVIETNVEAVSQREEISYVYVTDNDNLVRGTTDPSVLNQTRVADESFNIQDLEKVSIWSVLFQTDQGRVFEFNRPITFQDKQVGTISMGIPLASLYATSRLTVIMMTMLMIVTVLVALVLVYVLAREFLKPIKLVRRSMNDLSNGHYESRIMEERNDDFGLLYRDFNEMAESVQENEDRYVSLSNNVERPTMPDMRSVQEYMKNKAKAEFDDTNEVVPESKSDDEEKAKAVAKAQALAKAKADAKTKELAEAKAKAKEQDVTVSKQTKKETEVNVAKKSADSKEKPKSQKTEEAQTQILDMEQAAEEDMTVVYNPNRDH